MKNKRVKRILGILIALVLFGGLAVFGVNAYVKLTGGSRLVNPEDSTGLSGADCIIILGCQVKEDGSPSPMLNDRLRRGIELYRSNEAPKLLMSGDHGRKEYDEVDTMKRIAVESGIPSEDVFMDHAGFSTYESIYRAKEIFGVDRVIIVTQKYHLYRALYIAGKLGLDAHGVPSDYHSYGGQSLRELREILARDKDTVKCIFKPEPTFLGNPIPINGNGDATND